MRALNRLYSGGDHFFLLNEQLVITKIDSVNHERLVDATLQREVVERRVRLDGWLRRRSSVAASREPGRLLEIHFIEHILAAVVSPTVRDVQKTIIFELIPISGRGQIDEEL